MRPEFDKRKVEIVTLCTDSVTRVLEGHAKHGLKGTMLSDRTLEVTDLYGLRNQAIHTGPPSLPGLPVPTSILADATGIVRWMDQSENYQRRSDPDYVLSALKEHIA